MCPRPDREVVDAADIVRLERVLLRSWPPFEVERLGGVVLSAADGLTSRANSAFVLDGVELEERDAVLALVATVEAWYRERGLRTLFRWTPLAGPVLAEALTALGYGPAPAPCDVMVHRLGSALHVAAPLPAGARIRLDPEPMAAWFGLLGSTPRPGSPLERLLAQVAGRTVYVTVVVDGRAGAIGQGVVADGHVSLFNMRTRIDFRGSGLATHVVQAIERWGREHEATTATLQVRLDNGPAQALYRRCGYRSAYRYRYLTPEPAS